MKALVLSLALSAAYVLSLCGIFGLHAQPDPQRHPRLLGHPVPQSRPMWRADPDRTDGMADAAAGRWQYLALAGRRTGRLGAG